MDDIYDMPRADEPTEFEQRPSWRQVGPEGRAFDRQNFRANRTNKQAFRDGLDSTVVSLSARNLRQRVDTDDNIMQQAGQAIMALTGQSGKWGEYTWDRSEHFEEVTKDIPREYWEDIFKQTSLDGALITKRNIQDELSRAERIGMSAGALSAMSTAGMLLDVDLPLTLVSGGSLASAKVAGGAAYLARQAGGSLGMSRRAAGVAAGLSGGAQAGAIVGAGLALQSDTHDWMDATALMLSTTAFGGALGAVAPSMAFNMQRAHQDFIRRVREGDAELWAKQEPIVEPAHSPAAPPARPQPGETPPPAPTDQELTSMLSERMRPEQDRGFGLRRLVRGLNDTDENIWKQVRQTQAKERAADIEASPSFPAASRILHEAGLLENAKQIGAGADKVVLQSGDNVVRISRTSGDTPQPTYADVPFVAKPTAVTREGDLTIEVMPLLDTATPANIRERQALEQAVIDRKLSWADSHVDNIARSKAVTPYDDLTPAQKNELDAMSPEEFVEARGLVIIDGDVLPVGGVRDAADGVTFPDIRDTFSSRPVEAGTGAIPAVYPRGQSLSAGAVEATPLFPRLEDPMGPFSDTHANIITASRQRVDDANVQQQIAAKRESWIDRLGASKAFTLPSGTNDWFTLVRSESAVLRMLATDVFESASGYVRGNVANAGQLLNIYQGAIARHITHLDKHMVEWANAQGNRGVALGVTPFGVKRDVQSAFYKEVQLYVNEMSLGRTPPKVHPSVEQAALGVKNMGNEAAFILKGKQGQHAVSGSENLPTDGWYSPYRWNGSTIASLISTGQVSWSPPANRPNAAPVHRNAMRTSITDAIAEGYIKAGTVSDKVLAKAMADALVSRFANKGARLDDSMMSLFSGDGREYLRNSLRASNLSESEVTNIMRRFDAQAAERGKMASLKRRNDLDLSVPVKGTDLRLIDLLRQDYDNVLLGYSRETAGQAALARQGIRSRAEIEDYIQAAQAEQRALGEDVIDGDFLRAMFSEFNGGPQWGYAYGRTNKGVGDAVATAKAATSLSVLTFNGAAQLAETGVVMLATGLNNYFNRAVLPFLDKAMIQNNKRLLNEIEQAGFVVGRDHETMKPHLALDDSTAMRFHNSDSKLIMHRMREVVGKGNYLQGYTSMLNGIRSWQQRSAVLGIGDKVMKMVRAGDDDAFREGGRAFRDLGLNPDSYAQLQDALRFVDWEDGATGPFVKAFNFDQWPEQLVEDFTAALSRGMDQSVQRSLPGETSRWMHTEVGNLATHLKTFPMLAVQKQFIRNASQADAQAAGTVAAAFMSAYTAMYLRDKLTGRERDPVELVKAAFGYSNITGWMPMVSDPLVSMLGMPELRVNQFGAYSSPLEVPTVSSINNLARAPGGVWNVLQGKDNWTDRQAMRQLPFVRLAESAGRMAGFELIDAPRERPTAQRRQEQPSTPEQSMLRGQQQDRATFEQALE